MKGIFLKILAVISFAAVAFPFIISADTGIYGDISLFRLLYYYGIGIFISVLGYIGALITKAHKKLRIPIRMFSFLTFGAGFLSVLLNGDFKMVFSLGIFCIFMFITGERACYKNFADMLPLTLFGAYVVISLGCYIISLIKANENGLSALPDILLAAFVAEFAASALLINQSGIYERANMRKETKASLPKGLTSYNAALILGFTLTGLLLCVFRKNIAWVLEQCGIILIKAIFALFSLFKAEKMEVITEAADRGSFEGFDSPSPSAIILEALGIIALIVLIVVFRKKIFRSIKAFFSRLGALLGGHPEESPHPEFTDVFENYSSELRRNKKTDNVFSVKRRYGTETDPRQKYRLGYRVLLYRIRSVNQRLSPSDTTSVQAERGYERFGKSEMDSTVSVYDSIRYGDNIPDSEQLSDLDRLVGKQ